MQWALAVKVDPEHFGSYDRASLFPICVGRERGEKRKHCIFLERGAGRKTNSGRSSDMRRDIRFIKLGHESQERIWDEESPKGRDRGGIDSLHPGGLDLSTLTEVKAAHP